MATRTLEAFDQVAAQQFSYAPCLLRGELLMPVCLGKQCLVVPALNHAGSTYVLLVERFQLRIARS